MLRTACFDLGRDMAAFAIERLVRPAASALPKRLAGTAGAWAITIGPDRAVLPTRSMALPG
jgi:hypothetical protein